MQSFCQLCWFLLIEAYRRVHPWIIVIIASPQRTPPHMFYGLQNVFNLRRIEQIWTRLSKLCLLSTKLYWTPPQNLFTTHPAKSRVIWASTRRSGLKMSLLPLGGGFWSQGMSRKVKELIFGWCWFLSSNGLVLVGAEVPELMAPGPVQGSSKKSCGIFWRRIKEAHGF